MTCSFKTCIGSIVHFFIPAGGRFIENCICKDAGREYEFLIMLSTVLSVMGIGLAVLFAFVDPVMFSSEEQKMWKWSWFIIPVLIWVIGWVAYADAKRTYE